MVRAIDMQQVITQSPPVEKLQQTSQHQPDMQQRFMNIQLAEERKLLQEKVEDSKESEKGRIRERQEREQRRREAEHRRESSGQVEEGDIRGSEGPEEGMLIDIKV